MVSLASGMLINGTDRVTELAERLTATFWQPGNCGIAIANDTDHTMFSPQQYLNAGQLGVLPMKIKAGQIGLITASKTFGSPYGTAGVITYEFETTNLEDLPRYFQLMWSAPFFNILHDCQVNVLAANNTTANENLWADMQIDMCGELVMARNTVHIFEIGTKFQAMVYMGDSGPTPLAVTLSHLRN